jgi:uncharacterized surface protein with fasciclin (FAS1) repeats
MVGIVDFLRKSGEFSFLLKALDRTSLIEELSSMKKITFLAPNDKAFEKLPEGTLDALLNNVKQLKAILNCHILPNVYSKDDLIKYINIGSAQGCVLNVRKVTVRDSPTEVKIENAKILKEAVKVDNGLVYIIDNLIIHKDIGDYRPVSV